MKHESIDGLVVRSTNSGENDAYLSILSAKRGRFGLLAKGARSIKGGSLAISQPFTLANFEYYTRDGINILKGGRVEKSFFEITNCSLSAYLSFYLCDLGCELSDEEVEAGELLRLLLNSLYALAEGLYPERLVKAAFEWRAMALSGYMPALHRCALCGAEGEEYFFNLLNGSLVCRRCLSKPQRPSPEEDGGQGASKIYALSPATLAAMRYCLSAPVSRIFSFSLEEDDLRVFSEIAEAYVLGHLERSFKTLEFYCCMKEEPDLSSFGMNLKP